MHTLNQVRYDDLYIDHLQLETTFLIQILSQDIFLQPKIFPISTCEAQNIGICVAGLGNRKEFGCLAYQYYTEIGLGI